MQQLPVFQICSITGKTVRFWRSVASVNREFGYNNSLINRSCRIKHRTAYGYYWRYLNDYRGDIGEERLKTLRQLYKTKPVVQITHDGFYLRTYPSIKIASNKTNISNWHIHENCNAKRSSAGGFNWWYASDYFDIGNPSQKKTHKRFDVSEVI